ncbi:MAG TPA: hypothetical protein PKI03_16205 [Pseudomonadota bacterium]|nr:hypothetical protein [Pseudomonadota bacterium]
MLYGLWLMILGALAVPNLILKKPELKPTLDKITPYQGWIGAISALWGLWRLIWSLLNIGLMGNAFLWWVTVTATNALVLGLGLLLGVGTLKTFIKNGEAQAKLDETVVKLAPYQGNLGIAALIMGVVCIVVSIMPR